ncbi:hypothetical protein [Spiroplasma endosymbiont of Agriotes lineatus]|uniref:hypothetical protein n=1 Tax=Spiroplasma endosymbiont of Agriotes lineatus TaxID=3077930 RepID=UPI0030CC1D34
MKKKNIIKTWKTLPIFFIGGMSDPVSNFGKDVKKLQENIVNMVLKKQAFYYIQKCVMKF